ncbi:MAG: cation-translocating P-type ATPase [Candidatus Nanoarchaeia archaeon]
MDQSREISWHSTKDIENILETSKDTGLSENEVKRRQEKYGENKITQKKGVNPFLLLLSQFNQSLVVILIIAGLVTLFLEHYVDSAFIFLVVIINALIGFVQEYKAISAVNSLSKTIQENARVMRNGVVHQIPTSELTIGDLVLLDAGSKVPADLRVVRSDELRINESMLTGESVPTFKKVTTLESKTPLADRKNIAYYGTLVTSGSGKGLVVEIGDRTEIGKINDLIAKADILDTPLTIRTRQFSKMLLTIILVITVFIFGLGVLKGEELLTIFLLSVAFAVAVIPSGIPATITITLAIGVSRMAQRNAIITKLPAVETLGSTQVICSDKTGTLTQNKMTVQKIYTLEGEFSIGGIGYETTGEIKGSVEYSSSKSFNECVRAGVLCNDSHLEFDGETQEFKIVGDPTEASLLISAKKADFDIEETIKNDPRIHTIPFESKTKYMATLHESGVVYVKGAAEVITKKCKNAKSLNKITEKYAKEGLRVLGFAKFYTDKKTITHKDLENLEFLGFQAMIDPPREEVIESIKNCHQAQIDVKMITGDHMLTALAIAKKIGLKHTDKAVSGVELQEMSDSELENIIQQTSVFARVSPEDKIRLVKILQKQHKVVAMTGDGVNDAPALKQANIGTAMGITGTDVTKESADMVLLDDNFSTIEAAVQEGRGVYDNLVKFLTWNLPTNLGEGLIVIFAVILGGLLPIEPIQLLWVNMATVVLLGLMLAFEPKDKDIMKRPPHDSNSSFLTPILLQRIVVVGVILSAFAYGLFHLALAFNYSVEAARTVAMNMFIFGEMFYLFSCRNLKQPIWKHSFWSNVNIWYGVVAMFVLQMIITYSSSVNELFKTAPIGLWAWLWIISCSLAIVVVVETEKLIRSSNPHIENVE